MTTDPEYADLVRKTVELQQAELADSPDDQVAAQVLRFAVTRLDSDIVTVQEQIESLEAAMDQAEANMNALCRQRDACDRVAYTLSPPRSV